MVGDFSTPERTVIVVRFILCLSLVAFLSLVGVALAGASPEAEPAATSCHGTASCHGATGSCHGRTTVAQRVAARQTARQDARAAKRAAKAACHGEQTAGE